MKTFGRPFEIAGVKLAVALLAALGLYAIAYGARRAIVEAQYREWKSILPFTLESALYYRRVKIVHDTGRLPDHDPMVQFPEGIEPRKTYTVGSEYIYAFLARLFPSEIPFADRLRRIEAGWFSLAIPVLAWGVWRRTGSAVSGLWTGLFFALGLSSVIRSTGLELSHENFAMPFIAAHFALAGLVPAVRQPAARGGARLGAAAALGLAHCTWDLTQYYVGLVLLSRAGRAAFGRSDDRPLAWLEYAALFLAGVFNPYHAAHGWLFSFPMGLAHGLALWRITERYLPCVEFRRLPRAAIVFMCLLIGVGAAWLAGAFLATEGAYSHFTELLWAKIIFLNRKPADPSLLTFDQRIMWVPALNSTDWAFARMMFPALWVLTIPSAIVILWRRRSIGAGSGELIVGLVVSALSFWLFARFHVYLSLFACVVVGLAWAQLSSAGGAIRAVAAAAGAMVLVAEAAHTLRRPERWGRVNVYYEQLQDLTIWLEKNAAPDPVLANFGVSGSIAAYGKCAILLHPKFESALIRRRVKEYGEALFRGTEKQFRDWAVALGARYYVYAFGEFAPHHVDLQMRYFVDAVYPPPYAAARRFEFDPENLTWFVLLHRNVKYAVFKVIASEDEAFANAAAAKAEAAFQRGDLQGTRGACLEALRHFPRHPRALELLGSVASLEAKGFRGERRDQ